MEEYRPKMFKYSPGNEKDLVQVVQDYHMAFYFSQVWQTLTWMGHPIMKCPLDLWVYQEIIHECKPNVIIETGTFMGGSAVFLANMLQCAGIFQGRVISVDVKSEQTPVSKMITYCTGDSISPKTLGQIEMNLLALNTTCDEKRVMVILDSDHHKSHVLREMEIYGELVTPGQYMIIEDGNLNGHPLPIPMETGGPFEAVVEYLGSNNNKNNGFTMDNTRCKFGMTFNPNGYLKKGCPEEPGKESVHG